MHFFTYKGNKFYAEGVSIEKIVKEVGTPCYIYSHKTLIRHYHAFDEAFASVPHLICYSVKANSNIAILKTFINEGGGVDIVSGGELYRALKAGVNPKKVVYSGVGKRADEIEYALKTGILMFNVESPEELRAIDRIAKRLKKKAGIAIRVNPDVDPKTHPYISTGLKKNKFGIETSRAIQEYVYAKNNLKNVIPIGVDCHIGSQITQISPFADALKKTKQIISTLRNEGIDIKYLDMGGGLGITYKDEDAPHPSKYGKAVIDATKGLNITLIFEPGRIMVGNAGILVTKVLYTKQGTEKNFVIVDAAMNDLARPSLYGSYHAIKPVTHPTPPFNKGGGEIIADVVGPVCESGDFFAKDRPLPAFKSGELMALMSAGAYGFSMSSNYNSRPRACEVMVKGNKFSIIRERESYKDLIKGEKRLK
ncbi:MAG: diaminopimelate decarboxylase [Deltaproteobacteria bacterium GWF2_42_12]|nr:MAG: diaminopimelate decarboxylase [Deltaproteobacteria bacterium GWF2_42_12]OGQ74940.1 MAG: diaminopimelate decarboxylase [Deltaproteobacteria bacterium RIFOXYA2_FULL_42_10]